MQPRLCLARCWLSFAPHTFCGALPVTHTPHAPLMPHTSAGIRCTTRSTVEMYRCLGCCGVCWCGLLSLIIIALHAIVLCRSCSCSLCSFYQCWCLLAVVSTCLCTGAAVTHSQLQQAMSVLLAVVAAVSLGNAAGGAPRAPATLAQLLKAPQLTPYLQRGE